MDHLTHHTLHQPLHDANDEGPAKRSTEYTFRVPKPNWQVTALILIALIAAFQTIQLARLKSVVGTKVPVASASTTAAPSAASSSDLQAQVGGC